MKLDLVFRDMRSIYMDTSPLVYLVERNPNYIAKMRRIVDNIGTARLQVFTSVITLTEILVLPLRLGNTDLAQKYHDILSDRYNYKMVAITSEIAISAAAIRARHGLRTPDAMHAATAIKSECDAILTNDRHFQRVDNLDVLLLDELEL